jgi:hypothetical protein
MGYTPCNTTPVRARAPLSAIFHLCAARLMPSNPEVRAKQMGTVLCRREPPSQRLVACHCQESLCGSAERLDALFVGPIVNDAFEKMPSMALQRSAKPAAFNFSLGLARFLTAPPRKAHKSLGGRRLAAAAGRPRGSRRAMPPTYLLPESLSGSGFSPTYCCQPTRERRQFHFQHQGSTQILSLSTSIASRHLVLGRSIFAWRHRITSTRRPLRKWRKCIFHRVRNEVIASLRSRGRLRYGHSLS